MKKAYRLFQMQISQEDLKESSQHPRLRLREELELILLKEDSLLQNESSRIRIILKNSSEKKAKHSRI